MSIYYEPGSEGLADPNHHLNAALEAVAEVARKLKQERDEARADLAEEMKFHHRTHAELVETQCKLQDSLRERDEARELNAKLFALADRAIDDLRWFYESHADGISSELEKLKEAAK